MKSKLLITSLSLIATSAYAQPSMPAGVSPPANRPEVSRPATPSTISSGPMPANDVKVPTSVGATGVTTPMPPMPGNNAKGPTSVGVSLNETQARAEAQIKKESTNPDLDPTPTILQ